MCGIAGIFRKESFQSIDQDIKQMTGAISHRGPDGHGIYVNGHVAMGHRRLAIIDLESGQQPLCNHDKTHWITYNGELYNYKELRAELREKQYVFQTNSDTEVILNSYIEWGVACLNRFRGMFAFCIYDTVHNEFFLARDRFGIKPLVYRTEKDFFAFASEINALRIFKEELQGKVQSIEFFLRLKYIPAPDTIFHTIHKLPAASYMIVNHSGTVKKIETYWKLYFRSIGKFEDEYWYNRTNTSLKDSVQAHLVADVPFGVFLSGGIDSTLVAGYMQEIMQSPVKAFSIGFEDEDHNELKYAEQAAKRLGVELHTAIVKNDTLDLLPNLINQHYGEPFGDDSAIPTWYVSKLAREYVPMVLSGDGGDETFGGYYSYLKWMKNAPITYLKNEMSEQGFLEKSRFALGSTAKYMANTFSANFLDVWLMTIGYDYQLKQAAIWKKEFHPLLQVIPESFRRAHLQAKSFDRFSYAQCVDIQTYMTDSILTKVDIACMAHGLEVRPPLLDKELAGLFSQLPYRMKSRQINGDQTGKYLLKQLLRQKFPDDFIFRHKQGFKVPYESWFYENQQGREQLYSFINSTSNQFGSLFNIKYLNELLAAHSKLHDHGRTLWLLLVLGIWMEENKEITFN